MLRSNHDYKRLVDALAVNALLNKVNGIDDETDFTYIYQDPPSVRHYFPLMNILSI